MRKLSTGQDATLGSYLVMTIAVFGEQSPAVAYLQSKIEQSPKGKDEEVIADESQMIFLLGTIHRGS